MELLRAGQPEEREGDRHGRDSEGDMGIISTSRPGPWAALAEHEASAGWFSRQHGVRAGQARATLVPPQRAEGPAVGLPWPAVACRGACRGPSVACRGLCASAPAPHRASADAVSTLIRGCASSHRGEWVAAGRRPSAADRVADRVAVRAAGRVAVRHCHTAMGDGQCAVRLRCGSLRAGAKAQQLWAQAAWLCVALLIRYTLFVGAKSNPAASS